MIQARQRHPFQEDAGCRIKVDLHVITDLMARGHHGLETAEHSIVKFDDVIRARPSREVRDGVVAEPCTEYEGVVAGGAGKLVVSGATLDDVVFRGARDGVIAGAAIELIVAATTVERVVASFAK